MKKKEIVFEKNASIFVVLQGSPLSSKYHFSSETFSGGRASHEAMCARFFIIFNYLTLTFIYLSFCFLFLLRFSTLTLNLLILCPSSIIDGKHDLSTSIARIYALGRLNRIKKSIEICCISGPCSQRMYYVQLCCIVYTYSIRRNVVLVGRAPFICRTTVKF